MYSFRALFVLQEAELDNNRLYFLISDEKYSSMTGIKAIIVVSGLY